VAVKALAERLKSSFQKANGESITTDLKVMSVEVHELRGIVSADEILNEKI
jgi:hypothetical protein